jgi:hypothetical protein
LPRRPNLQHQPARSSLLSPAAAMWTPVPSRPHRSATPPSVRAPPVGIFSPKSHFARVLAPAGDPPLPRLVLSPLRQSQCRLRMPPRSPCPLAWQVVTSHHCALRKRHLPPAIAALSPDARSRGLGDKPCSAACARAPSSLSPSLPPRAV